MKKILLPMSAILVLGTGATFAQETGFQGGEINLEYNYGNIADLDTTTSEWSANFGAAYNIAPQFGLQVGAGYNGIGIETEVGADTIGASLNITEFDAHAYYNFDADSKMGVFAARASVGDTSAKLNGVVVGELPTSMDITIYGVEGMYNSGPVKIEARYGMAEIKNSELLGPSADEIEISFYELGAEYAVSSKFNLVGGIGGITGSLASDELTLNTYSVGVEYMVVENLSLTAGVNGGSVSDSTLPDESIDLFGYSVGAEYVLSGTTLFASYGTTNTSGLGIDEDETNLKVGASIAFGGQSSSDLFSTSGSVNSFSSLF